MSRKEESTRKALGRSARDPFAELAGLPRRARRGPAGMPLVAVLFAMVAACSASPVAPATRAAPPPPAPSPAGTALPSSSAPSAMQQFRDLVRSYATNAPARPKGTPKNAHGERGCDVPAPASVPPEPRKGAPETSSVAAVACRNAATIAAAKVPKVSPPPGIVMTDDGPSCWPSSHGAWGLIRRIAGYEEDRFSTTLNASCQQDDSCLVLVEYEVTPMHFDAAGVPIIGKPFKRQTPGDDAVALFDFDGDGEEEIVSWQAEAVYTSRGGVVQPYGPAAGLRVGAARDVDCDRRLDLGLRDVYDFRPELVAGCGKEHGMPLLGLGVYVDPVAHALPDGTFSTTDAAATEVARTICPAPPTTIVPKDTLGHVDNRKLRENVVCARLWGQAATSVLAELKQGCKRPPGDECGLLFADRDENRATPYCLAYDDLVVWAQATPPITLH
jgi:hypothetical protein